MSIIKILNVEKEHVKRDRGEPQTAPSIQEVSTFIEIITTGILESLKPALAEEIRKAIGNELGKTSAPVQFATPGLTYKPLYKMEELCELFTVTKPTIYDWIKRGKLKPHKIRSRVYFLWEDVERLIKGECK